MIAAAILTLVVVVYRVVLGIAGAHDFTWWHNFSPLAAVALCGAAYFPRRVALLFPLGALFISDLVLNASYGVPLVSAAMLPQYVALGLIAWIGWSLRGRSSAKRMLLASLGASVLFYVLTNLGAWLFLPEYPRTLGGLSQAMFTGLPGFPPTLFFFRHTVISDLVFTALFLACFAYTRQAGEQPQESESLRAQFARRLR